MTHSCLVLMPLHANYGDGANAARLPPHKPPGITCAYKALHQTQLAEHLEYCTQVSPGLSVASNGCAFASCILTVLVWLATSVNRLLSL